MAKLIMVQGTTSDAGKSILCAALCRFFRDRGMSVAPFKAQNMALNAVPVSGGGEIGWAQYMQAEAAGAVPTVEMNPVLLKPVSDTVSQVVVNGRTAGNWSATEYQEYKKELRPLVLAALDALRRKHDVVVVEGAGSPAEVNLRDFDIVNMGLALSVQAPVLLVADIDRGGAFASVVGTLALLTEEEKALIRGIVFNKFRGQKERLLPGLKKLETLCGKPTAGVLPYLDELSLPPEDSLWLRDTPAGGSGTDVAVIVLPRMANFTDYHVLAGEPGVKLRYVKRPGELGMPHLVIVPGTKNTLEDLSYLYRSGLAKAILEAYRAGAFVLGVCGGYQVLGQEVADATGCDGQGGKMKGLGLLNTVTEFSREKTTTWVRGFTVEDNLEIGGYKIHMGRTRRLGGRPFATLCEEQGREYEDGAVSDDGRVMGTYVHGLFDGAVFRRTFLNRVRAAFGLPEVSGDEKSGRQRREESYRLLARAVEEHLDTGLLHEILEGKQ